MAATTVAGNRLAQRWARESRPYAPSRTPCTGRTGSSAPTNLFVGAGVPDGPLTALLAMCHCETSDRCHWLWQSASPVPKAPLPKGGWHGEAVTGGYLTSPHLLYPSVGATLAVARGRGNRRSAAGGGRSEAISRKCPDWRPRQWPGIGWHNGGKESPAPTHHQEPTAPDGQSRPPLQTVP